MSERRPSIAVLRFPGMNCEEETRRSVLAAGASCDIFMWNGPTAKLAGYDGYVLPGGFSYQDRVRAGRHRREGPRRRLPVRAGRGGQAGRRHLQRGADPHRSGHGARHRGGQGGDGSRAQHHARQGRLLHAVDAPRRRAPGIVRDGGARALSATVPVPVAHAEGRFVTTDDGLVERLFEAGQIGPDLRHLRRLAGRRLSGQPERIVAETSRASRTPPGTSWP